MPYALSQSSTPRIVRAKHAFAGCTLPRPWLLCLAFALASGSTALAQPETAPNSTADIDETILQVEKFSVRSILQQIEKEAGLSGKDGEQWLLDRVRRILGSDGSDDANSQLSIQYAGTTKNMPLAGNGRGVLLENGEIVVVGSQPEIRLIESTLGTLSRFGIRQVVIRTHIYRQSADALAALPIRWSHIEAASLVAQPVNSSVRPAAFENEYQLTSPALAERYLASTQALPPSQPLEPPPGVTSANWTEASSIIERSNPVLYTLLSPQEYRQLLTAARDAKNVEKVMAPQIVVFNGQTASIADSVERPFVTGIKPVKVGTPGQEQIQFTPSIRVYPEGTSLQMRSELVSGSRIRLSCHLNLCNIRKVETLDIPRMDGDGVFTVQLPEVASTQFRTCLDLPLDYALAVSTTDIDETGAKTSVLVVCQCSVRNVEPRPTPAELPAQSEAKKLSAQQPNVGKP